MKTYRIHLLRHGRTQDAGEGRYIGRTDLPLSPEGFSELLQLRGRFTYPSARRFFTSPLTRCRQTLELLYPGSQPTLVKGLSECDFGEWEGKSVAELKADPRYRDWIAGKSGEIPGGESAAQFQQRVMAAFEGVVEQLLREGETEAVAVVPGGVMMLIMTAYGLPRLEMREWAAEAGCGFTLRITPEVWMREPVAEALCAIPWLEQEAPGEN